jgi:cyclopropane fatty-acyl-phospholipid synthase-like methyltransferase
MKKPVSSGMPEVMYHWRVSSVRKMLAMQGKAKGPLNVDDLTALGHLDQYHYLGKQTCYEIVEALQLDDRRHVLDIGSGVGGTSRVIAEASGCRVTAVELQEPLNELAEQLTQRVGLEDKIDYVSGSFMDYQTDTGFDHFVSLLVFLHIPDRNLVLRHCYRLLKPGGTFFIEDLVERKPFSEEEKHTLLTKVSAPSVSNKEAYTEDLQQAGFTDLHITDMSDTWRDWCYQRYHDFVAEEDFNRRFFGDEIYQQRSSFYRTICELFMQKKLGGLRVIGQKA